MKIVNNPAFRMLVQDVGKCSKKMLALSVPRELHNNQAVSYFRVNSYIIAFQEQTNKQTNFEPVSCHPSVEQNI